MIQYKGAFVMHKYNSHTMRIIRMSVEIVRKITTELRKCEKTVYIKRIANYNKKVFRFICKEHIGKRGIFNA